MYFPTEINWKSIDDPMDFVTVYDYNFKDHYDAYFLKYIKNKQIHIDISKPTVKYFPLSINMFIYWLLTKDNIDSVKFTHKPHVTVMSFLANGDIQVTNYEIENIRKFEVQLNLINDEQDLQFPEIKSQFNIKKWQQLYIQNFFVQKYILNPYSNIKEIEKVVKQYALKAQDMNYWSPKEKKVINLVYDCDGDIVQYSTHKFNVILKNIGFTKEIMDVIKENDYTIKQLKSFMILVGKNNFNISANNDKVFLKIECKVAIYPLNYYYNSQVCQNIDILNAYSGSWSGSEKFTKWAHETFNIVSDTLENLSRRVKKHIINTAVTQQTNNDLLT